MKLAWWRESGTPIDLWHRVRVGVTVLVSVFLLGVGGYMLLGLSMLDALYQTAITLSTTGYRELGDVDGPYMVFTIVLILVGSGTALFVVGSLLETFIEGRLSTEIRRQRMAREMSELRDHTVLCGWGQVGQAITNSICAEGGTVVVIDRAVDIADQGIRFSISGDATDDAVLRAAGIEHARALVVALDHDADKVYVTLSGRALKPDLFIVARATHADAAPKLYRAGADRVVNPHELGGSHMAALVMQPNVAEFLGVVMHDKELALRLEEHRIGAGSPLAGQPLGSACELADVTVLAIRSVHGEFHQTPPRDVRPAVGDVLIVLGTGEQHSTFRELLHSV